MLKGRAALFPKRLESLAVFLPVCHPWTLSMKTRDADSNLSRKKKRESKMGKFGKCFLLVTGFVLVATFVRVPGTITNVHAQDHGCSVASLKGTYAYLRSGTVTGLGPRAELGLDLFNGDGTRGIIRNTEASYTVSFDSTNSSWPSGSYKVDYDYTGTFFAITGEGTKLEE